MSRFSATDWAIANAIRSDHLKVTQEFSTRLQLPYWSISDQHGIIESCLTKAEAEKRIKKVRIGIIQAEET